MLRVLHLEDDPVDAEMILDLLREEGLEVESHRVDTLSGFREQLVRGVYELILSDYTVPGVDALETLRLARELRPEVPFIFISGTIPEDQAVESLKLGASDYVLKQGKGVGRLVPSIKRALQESRQQARREQAEAALRESEERFRTLVEAVPQLVWTCAPDGKCDYLSHRWFEYTGIQPQENLSPDWLKAVYPEDLTAVTGAWTEALRTGKPFQVELRLRHATGQPRWHLARALPMHDALGRVRKWVGTCTEIEEQKRTEAALAEARKNLERTVAERTAQLVEANTNLQTFAYTAAHDLRSPLRAIRSFSSIVAEEYGTHIGEDGCSCLQRVVQAADRMQQLLNDLLEFSKLSQAELKLEAVDLGKAINEALTLQEEEIQASQAQIIVEDAMPLVIGHAATVALIVHNLVANALKFMAPKVAPRIRIWSEVIPPFVRLSVQDNGIGIAKADQSKLFEVFHRLHGKQEYPGTGLGLAIVRKGIERMGGSVGVESELGQGSRFWVQLRMAAS